MWLFEAVDAPEIPQNPHTLKTQNVQPEHRKSKRKRSKRTNNGASILHIYHPKPRTTHPARVLRKCRLVQPLATIPCRDLLLADGSISQQVLLLASVRLAFRSFRVAGACARRFRSEARDSGALQLTTRRTTGTGKICETTLRQRA